MAMVLSVSCSSNILVIATSLFSSRLCFFIMYANITLHRIRLWCIVHSVYYLTTTFGEELLGFKIAIILLAYTEVRAMWFFKAFMQ